MGREEKIVLKRAYRRKTLGFGVKKTTCRRIIQSNNPVMTNKQLKNCLSYYKKVTKERRLEYIRLYTNFYADKNEYSIIDDSVHEYIIGVEKIEVITKRYNLSYPKLYEYIRMVRDIVEKVI
jgi:hypothetical protein